jgi:hypothetical protein
MISKGKLIPHVIRRAKRPAIVEVDKTPKLSAKSHPVPLKPQSVLRSTPANPTTETPTFLIIAEPELNPDFLAIEIDLPLLVHLSNSVDNQRPRFGYGI